MDIIKIDPEGMEIANAYLVTGSAKDAALKLNLPVETIHNFLEKKDVKTYVNQVYFDQGYRNRFKLAELLDEIIENKIQEARESELYTTKDLVDLIKLQHTMRMDEQKLPSAMPTVVNNTQNNFGNLGKLTERLFLQDE
jgi:hypothetical protein